MEWALWCTIRKDSIADQQERGCGYMTEQEIKALLENYKNETHKKGETFDLNDCHQLIDFFKSSINKHEDWKKFDFHFSETSSYQDLSGFYREVEQQGYKLSFKSIPESYIHQMVDEGKLYLFQIYNKDFSLSYKPFPTILMPYQ